MFLIIFIHHKHGSSKNNKCNSNINKYTDNKFLQIQTIIIIIIEIVHGVQI